MSTDDPYEPTMQQPAASPPDERQGRWPLAIAALIALIAILLIVFVLVSNNDDDDTLDAASTSTTAAESTTTTTEAESTTTTKPSASTSTAPAATVAPGLCKSSPPDDPDTTAQVVYQAYTLGDEDCADKLMTAKARGQLFAIPGKGGGWTFQGCTEQDVPDPHTDCAFSFTGGATHFRMNYGTGGWEVYDVYQTTD
jgi:hypothetical protein